MSKVALLNLKGEKVKDINLDDTVWGIEPNDTVIYDAIVLARASQRQGSHDTKTRAEVRGGGKKPWKQKGTGNARQGSIRSPQWRGGGIVFGPTPNVNYTKKQNKKERRLALKSMLSYKAINSDLLAIENLLISNNKTKSFLNIMKDLKLDSSTLFVTNELTEELLLSTRNVKGVKVINYSELNVLDLASYDKLVATEEAIKKVEEVLV
ncbi:MAG: 50S ribosomal protein L4 [Tenericutes bacterium]|nr:50S ribosomal protein L4 [Bacilli bacterium]NLV90381.1 50S ribosomal protein L4 [Mycoplasmatota bacterium]